MVHGRMLEYHIWAAFFKKGETMQCIRGLLNHHVGFEAAQIIKRVGSPITRLHYRDLKMSRDYFGHDARSERGTRIVSHELAILILIIMPHNLWFEGPELFIIVKANFFWYVPFGSRVFEGEGERSSRSLPPLQGIDRLRVPRASTFGRKSIMGESWVDPWCWYPLPRDRWLCLEVAGGCPTWKAASWKFWTMVVRVSTQFRRASNYCCPTTSVGGGRLFSTGGSFLWEGGRPLLVEAFWVFPFTIRASSHSFFSSRGATSRWWVRAIMDCQLYLHFPYLACQSVDMEPSSIGKSRWIANSLS